MPILDEKCLTQDQFALRELLGEPEPHVEECQLRLVGIGAELFL